MEEVKIPKEFYCFGELVKVVYNPDLYMDEDAYGLWHERLNHIVLQEENDSLKIPHDKIVSTFFHELVHCLLEKLEYRDLSDDEQFVERFSALLYQSLKTSVY
jgi:Zn-dependent peptidase ImmA (M78 family)